MRLTSTARVYFVDHNTKTTTWDGNYSVIYFFFVKLLRVVILGY